MASASEVQKHIDSVSVGGLFSPSKVTIYSKDSIVQETKTETTFKLSDPNDCRELLHAFTNNLDIMKEMRKGEEVLSKAMKTIIASNDFNKADMGMFGKIMEIGGDLYRSSKPMAEAMAAANSKASERGWGENVARNTMGALAKAEQRREDAMKQQ